MHQATNTPRLIRSFVQDIRATPQEVFPLLCPEREKEWLPGWDARMIHSVSGVAERGAIFETQHAAGRTLWIVTEYDPPRRVAFARWQPDGIVVHIEIVLANSQVGRTAVSICYTSTAVAETGAAVIASMDEASWLKNMSFWQESMNSWFEKPFDRHDGGGHGALARAFRAVHARGASGFPGIAGARGH